MALNLGTPRVIGQRGGLNLVVRQDSLLFQDFNMEIIQAAGAPVGEYEQGSMFLNARDAKLYLAANYKIANTPDLLWYKFNENAQDFSSGQKANGTVTSSTYTSIPNGKYRQAINLDGTDDKVEIPAAMGLDWDSDWTISFWINIDATYINGQEIYILERFKDADEYIYFTFEGAVGTAILRLRYANGGGETEVTSIQISGASFGTWVFVHLSHDTSANNIETVWIDAAGNVTANNTNAASIPNIAFTTEVFNIGRNDKNASFGDNAFILDDLKIFNEFRESAVGSKATVTAKIDSLNLDKIHWASYTGEPLD